jgi:hypothetical protein
MGLPACRELKQQFPQPESLATTLGRARLALESNPPALVVSLPIPGIEWREGKGDDADYTDRLVLLPASHFTASNVGRETLRLAAVSRTQV